MGPGTAGDFASLSKQMLLALLQSEPVMVRVITPAVEETSVVDVLIGSIGLTGVLILAAIVLGALLGVALIGAKHRRGRIPDSEALKIT